MKIYTKSGDTGRTSLYGGLRVSKDAIRVVAYGTVDELNASIGLARAETPSSAMDALLARLQHRLFDIGAELAAVPDKVDKLEVLSVDSDDVAYLETEIDRFDALLEPLKTFVLPGGSRLASTLHLARTVCRRAERHVVSLCQAEPVREEIGVYLNRVSDLLFVLARMANKDAGVPDIPWEKKAPKTR